MSGPFGAGALNLFSGVRKFYAHELDQSLRFNDNDTAMLSRTFPSAGNRRTWTWSGWIKRGNLGNTHPLFVAGSSGSSVLQFALQTSGSADRLALYNYTGSYNLNLATTQFFRDTAGWYNIVLKMDTTQATSSNRVKIYVNGQQVTSFSTSSYPSQNFETLVNSAASHRIGRNFDTAVSTKSLDGYVAEVNFVDAPIFTGATTSGSATVTGISSTASLKVGMAVSSSTSSVIADGTTIASIDSSSQITLSANATATNGSAPLTFSATVDFFGETKEGIWVPKQYNGPYGTNGFHLTFEDDTTVEGFNTVLFDGTGATKSISGVGFQPDLVWVKVRDGTTNHQWTDSVRGINKNLITNGPNPEDTTSTNKLTSFDSDGFTLGSNGSTNTSGKDYVAWCWDAGTGSAASNGNGTITSSVKANAARGFSIVTYTGNGTNGTVGHGLGAAPTWIMVKNRGDTENWAVWHTGIPITKYLRLNDTPEAKTPTNARWNDTAPTSTVFSVGDTSTGDNEVNANGDNYVAYCWTDISGYSKMGTYTGNGSSTGPTVTTGFKPAFLLIKRTDTADNWHIADNTRSTDGTFNDVIRANLSSNESANHTGFNIDYNDTGFTLKNSNSELNALNGTYIYMAFADTREYAFWTDQSGNNNDFQHTNLEHNDVVLDRPTNNFATLDPLNKGNNVTLSNGNLVTDLVADDTVLSTIHFEIDGNESWYAEMLCQTTPNNNSALGIVISNNADRLDDSGGAAGTYWYFANGNKRSTGSATSYGATWTTGDIIGIAVSGGAVTFYKNNASQGQAFTGLTGSYSIAIGEFNANGPALRINYGQDSSFGGLKIPQGNADANGNGDFFYAPPSNHLALCTDNLPTPGIDPNKGEAPDDYFNTVTYSGNGSTNAITGVGFQPDWVWAKVRNATGQHSIFDVVRGATKRLGDGASGVGTSVESTVAASLQSFDSDGFTFGNEAGNNSGENYVAWNWKAGGTAVSNTDGTISSSVSASPESGFSIVSYTGNNTAGATVGHGLNSAPEMIFIKGRVATGGDGNWNVYAKPSGGAIDETDYLLLNSNTIADDNAGAWNDTAATSSVFSLGTFADSNGDGKTFIAYCFHSVEGYSKIGTYKGNADTDGPFIYTGFRPAFVLSKILSGANRSWHIMDNKREGFNPQNDLLFTNSNTSESDVTDQDLLSNGFKLRTTGEGRNRSNSFYLYLAFAEQPFKYANAR